MTVSKEEAASLGNPSAWPVDPKQLRTEVRAAADAFVDAIWGVVPANAVAGIYVKGSALKSWDSPIDYVPVLSDVDVHLLFANEEAIGRFRTLENALNLSRGAEAGFLERVPDPAHIPRLQLVIANQLFADPAFIPSPIETVEERLGPPYPRGEVDLRISRSIAIKRTLEIGTFLLDLPKTVEDLTGPHVRRALRELSWRVAPTGPRMLELLGLDWHTCWSSNRTHIAEKLDGLGESGLAASYRSFYLQSWEYFLSGDRKGEPARQATCSAVQLLERAIEIAGEALNRRQ